MGEAVFLCMAKLDSSYYQSRDVLFLAKDLLGKFLVTKKDGLLTSGMIVETEAYGGVKTKHRMPMAAGVPTEQRSYMRKEELRMFTFVMVFIICSMLLLPLKMSRMRF